MDIDFIFFVRAAAIEKDFFIELKKMNFTAEHAYSLLMNLVNVRIKFIEHGDLSQEENAILNIFV